MRKKLLNENYNEPGCLPFYPDGKKQKLYIGESTGNGKITLDLQEGTVTVDGADGDYIYANGKKVTVKNSNIGTIGSHAEKLEIQNTREKGLLWDSATKIEAGKDTQVKIDNSSDVEITRDKE